MAFKWVWGCCRSGDLRLAPTGAERREFPNKLPVAVIYENELLAAKAKLALDVAGQATQNDLNMIQCIRR